MSKEKLLKGDRGRGSFVYFLSSATFSLILRLLAAVIRERLIAENKAAVNNGIMVDSSQDVTA